MPQPKMRSTKNPGTGQSRSSCATHLHPIVHLPGPSAPRSVEFLRLALQQRSLGSSLLLPFAGDGQRFNRNIVAHGIKRWSIPLARPRLEEIPWHSACAILSRQDNRTPPTLYLSLDNPEAPVVELS